MREGDSYFPENMLEVEKKGKLELITNHFWLCDEVELKLYDGHTAGQIAPCFYLENGKTVVYTGDVIPLKPHCLLRGFRHTTLIPVTSMEDKEKLLSEIKTSDPLLNTMPTTNAAP